MVSWLELTNPVGRLAPFQRTTELGTKPLPFTASTRLPLSARTLYAGTFGGGVFAIQQVEPSPTPTPTSPRTPTSTPTGPPIALSGGGGCTLTPRGAADSDLLAYLLVPAALSLLRVRRRTVRVTRPGR